MKKKHTKKQGVFTYHSLSIFLYFYIIQPWICVLVSKGCYNKEPQTGWLSTTEIYFLIAPEAGSLRSRCQQGWFLFGGSEGESLPCPLPSFQPLLAILGILWLVDSSPQSLLLLSHGGLPVRLCLHMAFPSVCVCVQIFLILQRYLSLD